jgi:hypothetical protein
MKFETPQRPPSPLFKTSSTKKSPSISPKTPPPRTEPKIRDIAAKYAKDLIEDVSLAAPKIVNYVGDLIGNAAKSAYPVFYEVAAIALAQRVEDSPNTKEVGKIFKEVWDELKVDPRIQLPSASERKETAEQVITELISPLKQKQIMGPRMPKQILRWANYVKPRKIVAKSPLKSPLKSPMKSPFKSPLKSSSKKSMKKSSMKKLSPSIKSPLFQKLFTSSLKKGRGLNLSGRVFATKSVEIPLKSPSPIKLKTPPRQSPKSAIKKMRWNAILEYTKSKGLTNKAISEIIKDPDFERHPSKYGQGLSGMTVQKVQLLKKHFLQPSPEKLKSPKLSPSQIKKMRWNAIVEYAKTQGLSNKDIGKIIEDADFQRNPSKYGKGLSGMTAKKVQLLKQYFI